MRYLSVSRLYRGIIFECFDNAELGIVSRLEIWVQGSGGYYAIESDICRYMDIGFDRQEFSDAEGFDKEACLQRVLMLLSMRHEKIVQMDYSDICGVLNDIISEYMGVENCLYC